MKRTALIIAAIAALLCCAASCTKNEFSTIQAEYGWDMNGATYLSFDNYNMARNLNSELCEAVDNAFTANGFDNYQTGSFFSQKAMSNTEAKALLKLIVSRVKPDSYTVSGYNYDFVIRYKLYDKDWVEVYRKNLYKPAE